MDKALPHEGENVVRYGYNLKLVWHSFMVCSHAYGIILEKAGVGHTQLRTYRCVVGPTVAHDCEWFLQSQLLASNVVLTGQCSSRNSYDRLSEKKSK